MVRARRDAREPHAAQALDLAAGSRARCGRRGRAGRSRPIPHVRSAPVSVTKSEWPAPAAIAATRTFAHSAGTRAGALTAPRRCARSPRPSRPYALPPPREHRAALGERESVVPARRERDDALVLRRALRALGEQLAEPGRAAAGAPRPRARRRPRPP